MSSTLVLGFLLLLGLQVWAAPSPGIEDAAYTNQALDLLAEDSAPSPVKEIPHLRHRRHHFYHHDHDFSWNNGHNQHNQYFPNSGCHHRGFGAPAGPWSHHGPPHPFGFGPPGPPPDESKENHIEPQPMIEISTTTTETAPPSTQPPPTPPPTTTTTTLATSSTESDTLDIDIRIG
ncbi:uncharacterized protein Dwil_GK28343 [Drosophila willistoni]|uniref:Uncharacterized protein n=1 Tax=Drosophila willistoni TaxID=7260 RepID=A0A0Q9X2F3_DROWI|nr:uncharacterized protein Dwil_GK28343 [Drosophila willistoni]